MHPDQRVGEIYLSADDVRARVAELGREVTADYEGLEPVLVGSLKASVVFLSDLSRATRIHHWLDFIELSGYGPGAELGGRKGVRLIKDLDVDIVGRHVLLVQNVIDTGLTLNYVVRSLALRRPASMAVITLLDRPYRRLVADLPVRYVGFTVPDILFVGYGFDLDARYRNLPDLRVIRE